MRTNFTRGLVPVVVGGMLLLLILAGFLWFEGETLTDASIRQNPYPTTPMAIYTNPLYKYAVQYPLSLHIDDRDPTMVSFSDPDFGFGWIRIEATQTSLKTPEEYIHVYNSQNNLPGGDLGVTKYRILRELTVDGFHGVLTQEYMEGSKYPVEDGADRVVFFMKNYPEGSLFNPVNGTIMFMIRTRNETADSYAIWNSFRFE